MTDANLHLSRAPAEASWSNRVLLLSLAGILFLTLYPFRFVHQESGRFLFPLSLNGWGKGTGLLDTFLNVLLFIPFGFGLAERLRERGKSKLAAFLVVYVAGAALSYCVEFLQIYIPLRDSGWGDIITNSAGAAIGALVFDWSGAAIVAWFSARERALDSGLGYGKVCTLLVLYTGCWCVLIRPLQKSTQLGGWTPDSFLAVGDSASLRSAPAWKGRILELELWNRAVPAGLARQITSRPPGGNPSPGATVVYRLSGAAPFPDERHFLPDLAWASQTTSPARTGGAAFDGDSWLITAGPVPTLVSSIERSGQFALRVLCQPGDSGRTDARIVSLSSPSGVANLELRQYGSALAFWFRDPFTLRRARMTWIVPHVFATDQVLDLLLSFNGTTLSLYVDGQHYGQPYELGPGMALARYIRRVKAVELQGYNYIFYAIIFFPAGCVLGFAWRRSNASRIFRWCILLSGFLLPALLVEWALLDAAGRALSLQNVWLSALLVLAGSLWINADRSPSRAPGGRGERVSVS
jgi:VanZ family protein